MKLSDISVSRLHALFAVSQGKVYLRDNNSKFGTLVLRKDPIKLDYQNNKSPWLQYGRTILKFELRKPLLAYLPCMGSSKTNFEIILYLKIATEPVELNDESSVRDPSKSRILNEELTRFMNEGDLTNITKEY